LSGAIAAEWAMYREGREAEIGRADYHFEQLKVYNRLAKILQLESFGQYEYLGRMLDSSIFRTTWLRSEKFKRPIIALPNDN
jgi:hypothetical protein